MSMFGLVSLYYYKPKDISCTGLDIAHVFRQGYSMLLRRLKIAGEILYVHMLQGLSLEIEGC